MVSLKANLESGLHKLKTGEHRSDNVMVKSHKGKFRNTLMCHFRLGLINEKGLQILSKKGVLGNEKLGDLHF